MIRKTLQFFLAILVSLVSLNTFAQCDPGTMQTSAIFACAGQTGGAQATNSDIGPNCVLSYVLHEGAGLSISNMVATNSTGVFDMATSGAQSNVQYYICAIAGVDADNDGLADMATATVSNGTPIVFMNPIVLTATESCDAVTGQVSYDVFFGGGGFPDFSANNIGYTFGGDLAGMTLTPGQTVTVGPLPNLTPFSATVSDQKGCMISESVTPYSCACQSDAGVMPTATSFACPGQTVGAQSANFFTYGSDAICYVLHSSATDVVGTVYATSSTGVFSQPATLPVNTLAYISAVVGDSDGAGCVDLVDPCDVAEGTPVVWLGPVDVDVQFVCVGDPLTNPGYSAIVTVTGGSPGFNNSQLYSINGTISGTIGYNVSTTFGPYNDGDPFSISVSDSKGCSATFNDAPPCCGCDVGCVTTMTCDDGDPCTINDSMGVSDADGVSICVPCAGTPTDCSTGATSVVSCDDGNPCTINDEQTILDCDGSICVPCAGTPTDCSTGATSVVSCDDGNPCTINDEQTILDCDGSICVPCLGEPAGCNDGQTSVVACDDGDPCTINDEQTINDCDGGICVPCAGTPTDCSDGTTSVIACNDGDPCTINDVQTILDCDGSICVPCLGEPAACSDNPPTSIMSCDDGNPCTINDVMTVSDCDASVCIPCAGTLTDCSTGTTTLMPCNDGDSTTENDVMLVLDCDGSICEPCEGTPIICPTISGGTPSGEIIACSGETITVQISGALNNNGYGSGSILTYALHDSPTSTPGNIISVSQSGSFSDPLNVDCQSLYVSAIYGPDADNDGIPDLDAYCTVVEPGTAVMWLEPISLSTTETCDKTTGEFSVNITVGGGYPACFTGGLYDITGSVNFQGVNAGTHSGGTFTDGAIYNATVTDQFNCTTSFISQPIQCVKLPITLVSFDGEAKDNGNLLTWVTGAEINNDYFTLYSSTNAIDFKELGKIQGNGTISTKSKYSFLDNQANAGSTFYRLTQTDFDGTTSDVKTIEVSRENKVGIEIASLLPVPVKSNLQVNVNGQSGQTLITVYDALGKVQLTKIVNITDGLNSIDLDLSNITSGVYFINIENNGNSVADQFIKQ